MNSNPATIMTDPEWADATYLEPLDATALAEIVARERPDALLPTLGGQTALNLAVELAENGVLAEHGVELIGADLDAIRTRRGPLGSGRRWRRPACPSPRASSYRPRAAHECPVPAVVRPAFTLGGRGGGIARTEEELRERVAHGLDASPIGQVLVERSLEGWQEFELEVVVDTAGNCVVVCSIENLDPIGVHTGDSWTVAPQQTLPDGELQRLRDAAFACARAVGVATGGANVQFAYEPQTRELALIEMNPRVSRSSALASKATGFPIAKLAALLAVGYTLDELPNDITGASSAAFEPALDYVAVKAPRFDFEKFPGQHRRSGTEMRAVGEALGIGRTFPEALLKALEGVEAGDALPEIPGLHPYFAAELASIGDAERELVATGDIEAAKRFGLPDRADRQVLGLTETDVRGRRGLPGRLAVDSCAGEFEAGRRTTTSRTSRATATTAHAGAIVVLGSGTNRIGQGIEFDYCCVRAAQAFRRLGHEVVLVNSNPATVSTDYDTCDRLYLEPVTLERVLDVVALEQPLGVVVSLGGQTPLGLAAGLADAGVPLLGDPLAAIEVAEDGRASPRCSRSSACARQRGGTPRHGGRAHARRASSATRCWSGPRTSSAAAACGSRASAGGAGAAGPALVDRFLEGALELDVDVLCDGEDGWVAAIVEHVERAGVHSGDSACVLPAPSVGAASRPRSARSRDARARPRRARAPQPPARAARGRPATCSRRTRAPRGRCRSSRRRPAIPLVDHACRLLLGESLAELGLPERVVPSGPGRRRRSSRRERFAGAADRGVEMRSTGEVMAGGADGRGRVPPRAPGGGPSPAARRRRRPALALFEQFQPVLELGEPELERLELLAPGEPELAGEPLAGLLRQVAEPLDAVPQLRPSSSRSCAERKAQLILAARPCGRRASAAAALALRVGEAPCRGGPLRHGAATHRGAVDRRPGEMSGIRSGVGWAAASSSASLSRPPTEPASHDVVAAACVLRLALLEHGEQRGGDEDRRVGAGADADEQREREVLQRLAAEEVERR